MRDREQLTAENSENFGNKFGEKKSENKFGGFFRKFWRNFRKISTANVAGSSAEISEILAECLENVGGNFGE